MKKIWSRLTNEEACALSNSVLRVNPFFGHFADISVYSPAEGIDPNTNAALRAQLRADAIPAESFASGRNLVPAWDSVFNSNRNVNLVSKKSSSTSTPWTMLHDDRWLHNFFLSVPYMFVNAALSCQCVPNAHPECARMAHFGVKREHLRRWHGLCF